MSDHSCYTMAPERSHELYSTGRGVCPVAHSDCETIVLEGEPDNRD